MIKFSEKNKNTEARSKLTGSYNKRSIKLGDCYRVAESRNPARNNVWSHNPAKLFGAKSLKISHFPVFTDRSRIPQNL